MVLSTNKIVPTAMRFIYGTPPNKKFEISGAKKKSLGSIFFAEISRISKKKVNEKEEKK